MSFVTPIIILCLVFLLSSIEEYNVSKDSLSYNRGYNLSPKFLAYIFVYIVASLQH